MITLNDIHHWEKMTVGDMYPFASDRPRPITLDFNTSGPVCIYILLEGEKEARLLALISGRETVKAAVPGAYKILHKSVDEEVYILTRDGMGQHRVAIDEESYTKLHEYVEADPHLLAIEKKLMSRLDRREGVLRKERERLDKLAETIEARTNAINQNADDTGNGQPVADTGAADDTSSPPDGGPDDVQPDGNV